MTRETAVLLVIMATVGSNMMTSGDGFASLVGMAAIVFATSVTVIYAKKREISGRDRD